MKFPEFTDDLSIVSKLGDNPGADNGLTAEGLKAKFDEGPLALQRFLNSVLITKLNEIFVAGGQLNDGLIMTGPINMNQNMLFGLADPKNDSEAVSLGFAKNNYAPSGYGLGGVSKQLTSADDLNNIKANGWYQWNDNDKPKNVPTGANTSYLSAMRVTVCGGACLQEIFDVSDSSVRGCSVQRTIYGSLVYEWEWVNPPMIADTEYRTIERYKGNPVYTMLVDFGTLPSNSYRDEEFTDVSVTAIRIECIGNYIGEHTYADLAAVHFVDSVQVMNNRIRITTNADSASKWNAMVRVWYTKG